MTSGLTQPVAARFPLPRGVAFLLFGLLLTVPSLFTRDLWNPDEPRYAEVAREMVVLDDWLVPHLNGDIYAEKPPLYFWLSAALQKVGFGHRSGRAVTGAFLIGSMFVTFLLARMWLPARAATIAAFAVATAYQFLWMGRSGVIDVPLAFCTTLAVYLFCRHRRDGGFWIAGFYLVLGLGILMKGPVALLVAGCGALAFGLATQRERPGRPWHLLWGPLLTAAVVAAWLGPAIAAGGEEYGSILLFRQNLGRVVSSWSHGKSITYYLGHLPPRFLPWIFLVPWGLWYLWKQRSAQRNTWDRAVVIWFAAAFIAFSLISGKRARYMVPLFPPLAIAVGALTDHLITAGARALRGRARLLLMVPHLLFLAIGSLFLALWGAGTDLARSAGIDDPDTLAAIGRALTGGAGTGFLLVGVGLVVIGGGCAVAAGRGRAGIVTAGLVAAMAVVSLGFDFVLAPQMNEVKSGRDAARRIDELAPPGERGQVALYPNVYSGVFNLYTGRIGLPVLETPAALNQFLASPEFGLVVLTRKVFDRDAAQITAPFRVVEADRVGHRTYLYLLPPASP